MAITQGQSLRKASGGRNTSTNPKKLHQKANKPTLTTLGEKRKKTTQVRGGKQKTRLLSVDTVNLYDPKKKKHVQAKVENVLENPSNQNYVRRNILTKGAIIETNKGKAKVTGRPGQENHVNATLIK